MKTSNKLLLTVFLFAIVILIAANIVLKLRGKKNIQAVQTEWVNQLPDSIATDTISIKN
jgi:hypothetical protein